MKSFLHIIFYINNHNLSILNKVIVFSIFILCQYSYAQNNVVDSITLSLDTISPEIPTETSIYIGEHTKVYVTKGTVTKNFESNIEEEKLVYVDPIPKNELTIEPVILLAETKPQPQLKNHKVELDQLEQKANKVHFTKNSPFTTLSTISNQKIAATNHYETFIKASINNQTSDLIEAFTSYFYKKTYYYYTAVGISYCIANLEIRSPSFFI